MKRLIFAAAWIFAAAISFGAAPAPHIPTTGVKDARAVNFSEPLSVIELRPSLSAYHGAVPTEEDGSLWYMLTVVNNSAAPETRVLQAGESPRASLGIFPPSTRPLLLQVASSDADVQVVGAADYARHTFRVTIPPSTSVSLALRVQNSEAPPSVLAWNEGALASQYRQLAIFMSVVAGLIGATSLIIAGLAIMTAHAAPRWAALMLFAVLFTRLSATAMFDTSLATSVGGPYGLAALFAGLALAAGIKLVDVIAPFDEQWSFPPRYLTWTLYGVAILSLLAYLGIPFATVLVEILVLFGTSALAAYLVHRGRMGFRPARTVAPAATVFALVALAAAATSVGLFGDNAAASAVVGGFAAAGTVLLALAIVAGEGIVIVPHWRLPGHHAAPRPEPVAASSAPQAASPQTTAALAAIGASHQGVFDLDIKKGIVSLSTDAANLIGYKNKPQQFVSADWIARIHPEDREVYQQAVEDFSAHTGLAFRIEFRVKSEGGRYPWFELRATMLGDHPPASRCLGLMADVTTRKEAEAAAGEAHAAPPERPLRDALTGLGNRLSLMEDLERADFANSVFALLDIDRFKSIHASLGDTGADALLVKIAERLATRFERKAQIFRIGGDSFAALFSSARIAPSALGADLMEACSSPYVSDGRTVFAPASVGVVQGSDARDPFELIKNAEIALSQAKRQGGGIVKVYGREMEHLAAEDSVVLETELRRALDDNQLDVFYQPIVRLSDRTVAGFEALLRWHHPTKGLVAPDDFIAHSEATGLIVSLGRFALDTAAKELSNWQRFFPLNPPLFVTVNLSRRQLRDSDFEGDLKNALSRNNIAPGTLKLELTETAVSAGVDIKPALEKLRAAGSALVMDDFGTGISNLSQFKDLPFDTLKIDRSFVARHSDSDESSNAAVLRSMVSLAHELDRTVVVEGVESEHDAAWVKELGCDYAQGFCFSQPLPAAEALNYLSMHFDEKTAVPASGAAGVGG